MGYLRSVMEGVGDEFISVRENLISYCNYDEALKDKDADLWQKDMKSEMQSMYSNQVWDLMEPLEGIKPIGYK